MKELFKKIGRGIVKGALYIYLKLVYRVKIIGKENIPKDDTLIFCGNHRNFLDAPLIVTTAGVHVRFMAKEELSKNKFLAVLGAIFEAIYVKRDEKDVSAIKTTLKALKNRQNIALFPEGTRNGIEKGKKVKGGASFFAIRTGAKVIPVGMSGGEKPFKQLVIKYGKPLDFSKYKEEKQDKDVVEKATEEIMEQIQLLTK